MRHRQAMKDHALHARVVKPLRKQRCLRIADGVDVEPTIEQVLGAAAYAAPVRVNDSDHVQAAFGDEREERAGL